MTFSNIEWATSFVFRILSGLVILVGDILCNDFTRKIKELHLVLN